MDYPFITAIKQAFDQTSSKSGGQVFWRLDQWTKGKSYLVHNNSMVGDAVKSWELLKNNLVSLYKFGGVRQFDISFRESVNDSHPRLFPVDLSTEEAVKAMTKQNTGYGIAGLDGEGFGGGIAGVLQLMAEKHEAQLEKEKADLEWNYKFKELETKIAGAQTTGDRFIAAIERLLDKPGVPEKLLDKMFPEPVQVAGGPQSDTAQAGDGSTDFTGLIRERMAQMGWEVANVDVDYNKSIEATLILKQVPGVDDPGQLLMGVAEFVKANPARAMQMFSDLQNSATA